MAIAANKQRLYQKRSQGFEKTFVAFLKALAFVLCVMIEVGTKSAYSVTVAVDFFLPKWTLTGIRTTFCTARHTTTAMP